MTQIRSYTRTIVNMHAWCTSVVPRKQGIVNRIKTATDSDDGVGLRSNVDSKSSLSFLLSISKTSTFSKSTWCFFYA